MPMETVLITGDAYQYLPFPSQEYEFDVDSGS